MSVLFGFVAGIAFAKFMDWLAVRERLVSRQDELDVAQARARCAAAKVLHRKRGE